MLTLDTETQRKHARRSVIERTRDLSDRAVKTDWSNAEFAHGPDGDIPTTSLAAQLGRPLSRPQFEDRLRKCNSNLFVETSINFPDKAGIYIVANEPDEIGVRRPRKKFLTGIESGFMPEFSVRHVESETVPHPDTPGEFTTRSKFTGETRGWRTVLARLVRQKVVRLVDVRTHFETHRGRQSKNWASLTN